LIAFFVASMFVIFFVASGSGPLHHAFLNAVGRSTSSGSAGSESSGGTAGLSPGQATVSVGGQLQDITGPVTCNSMGVGEQIGIGKEGGIDIMLEAQTGTPTVDLIQFGGFTSYDGVTGLEVSPGDDPASANAKAVKDGQSYEFTGTAEGTKDNSSQGVTRSFKIDVTCP
jgi:lipoprotein LpqH